MTRSSPRGAHRCLMTGSRWISFGSLSRRRPITLRALRRSSTSRGPSSSPPRTNAHSASTPSRVGRSSSAGCLSATSKDRRLESIIIGKFRFFPIRRRHTFYTKYPGLYLNTALYRAALHAVGEEQTAANYKQMSDETIQKAQRRASLFTCVGLAVIAHSNARGFG